MLIKIIPINGDVGGGRAAHRILDETMSAADAQVSRNDPVSLVHVKSKSILPNRDTRHIRNPLFND
jgi:hypothetical protein